MNKLPLIAGVDEVGRGPLVGAVVTAAVILDPRRPIDGLNDSKKLTEKQREKLVPIIQENALAFAYGRAEAYEIDELNILQASLLAMRRAVEALPIAATEAWVDGNKAPDMLIPVRTFIKGDANVPAIGAASILAKVARDHEMRRLHDEFPMYGFDRHKGYPTKAHFAALQAHGPCPQHRRSFAPVQAVLRFL